MTNGCVCWQKSSYPQLLSVNRYDVRGGIPHEAFYKCASLGFLTEIQVNDLLNKFEALKGAHDDESSIEEARESARSSFRSSRPSFAIRQQSTFFGRKKFSRKIQRVDFIARYPMLLLEVPSGNEKIEKEGVDIAFENLSLTVNKGGKHVKVVNDVTGRLRAGTMTALMGGSGAGEGVTPKMQFFAMIRLYMLIILRIIYISTFRENVIVECTMWASSLW